MKKRYPKMKYPWNLERSFDREINKFLDEFDKDTREMIEKELKPMLDSEKVITAASLATILAVLRKKYSKVLTVKAIEKVVQKSITSISSMNKVALEHQLKERGASNLSSIKSDAWLKEYTKVKIKENVSYIQGIADNYRDKVEQAVYRTITQGSDLSELREQIQKISEKSHSQASFIARDQVGTILGQINAKRQEQAGFPAFRWSDSGDNRVRPDHAERNGKIYFYEDNPKLPGEDYNCRCVAEPVDEYELEEIAGDDFQNSSLRKTSKLISEAERHEPDVTKTLKEVVSETDGKLVGLDYRLKSFDSLKRKLDVEGTGKQIRDVLRYTVQANDTKYTKTYYQIIDDLHDKGYNVSVVKNYWEKADNPYNGLNLFLKDKKGYEFELQFHTPESYKLKNGKLHELYEKQRVLDPIKDASEIIKLNKEMEELSASLPKPKNVEKIGGDS